MIINLLAHDIRWQIISLLLQSDYRVNELVDAIEQPMNLISYHLRQLREANVVQVRRSTADRRDIFYSVDIADLHDRINEAMQSLHPAFHFTQDLPSREQIDLVKPLTVFFVSTKEGACAQIAQAVMHQESAGIVQTAYYTGKHTDTMPQVLRQFLEDELELPMHPIAKVSRLPKLEQPPDTIIGLCDDAYNLIPKDLEQTKYLHWTLPESLPDTVNATTIARQKQQLRRIIQALRMRVKYFLLAHHRPYTRT